MGFADPHSIKLAGTFLLRLLAWSEDLEVDYSTFYDGEENTAVLLAYCLCKEKDEFDDCLEHGCHYIDLAVDQLEEAGYLTRTWLDSKLADGHPDYRIGLSNEGHEFFLSGKSFMYQPAE